LSRLTDLIAQAKSKDPQLGADLEREFKSLSSRLPFGLNFERHRPEAVELSLRPVRKGDKVRILPPRGSKILGDPRLWLVKSIPKAKNVAVLESPEAGTIETQTVALDDLVVVAEFRDTIYPGLVSTGKVERGGDKPYHTVINGENYHVLKALTYTHRGKIDAIYIDPPYNTGAKDWKYNNNYVEEDDLYRHSKWLAMMERRLIVSKELLNASDSVLIVTIDEKEYLRLGLLLEQIFPEATIQMVTSVISPFGVSRKNELSRVEEYIYYVAFGSASLGVPNDSRVLLARDDEEEEVEEDEGIEINDNKETFWFSLMRAGSDYKRHRSPGCFFPIFITDKGDFHSIGDALDKDESIKNVIAPKGTMTIWPINQAGEEARWQMTPDVAKELFKKGYARVGRFNKTTNRHSITYLRSGTIKRIERGDLLFHKNGTIDVVKEAATSGRTVWAFSSHNATSHGTKLLKKFLPGRKFPYPKSLFAVEDSLRVFLYNKPNATVLDFFAGSGTTAHATMRLNKQDKGTRKCISVTNNEVSASEHEGLRGGGLRPGDTDWEKHGICEFITKPRIAAAITGKTPEGVPIKGDYKFTDEFPMAEGFEENAEFFTLTYEARNAVNHNLAFSRIAPLLWMRSGSQGTRIDSLPTNGWKVVETYGLLTEVDQATPFIDAVKNTKGLKIAYIVTDDDRRFQAIAKRLPNDVEPVRLYESYLTNFSFDSGN
jgi:adenine-specific DNA-methyltransferase